MPILYLTINLSVTLDNRLKLNPDYKLFSHRLLYRIIVMLKENGTAKTDGLHQKKKLKGTTLITKILVQYRFVVKDVYMDTVLIPMSVLVKLDGKLFLFINFLGIFLICEIIV